MKFSIIIPSYNRAELLAKTINSALNQTFDEFEVIAVNDGSTDDTKEILDYFREKITVINKENSGAEKTRNAGAEIAQGEYLLFLDDDDLFFPWTLKVYDEVIKHNNYPPLVIGQPLHFTGEIENEYINYKPEIISFVSYNDYFSKDRPVYSSSSMLVVKKEFFYKVGGFRKLYNTKDYFLDDIDFLLRAGTLSPVVIIYRPFQFGYRSHTGNSVKNVKRVIRSLIQLVEEEKSGVLAGGKERIFERYAIIGGPSFFWLKKALRKGVVSESIILFFKTFPMILTGFLKKMIYFFKKKKNMETINLI